MSIFGTIKDAIFGAGNQQHPAAQPAAPVSAPAPAPAPAAAAQPAPAPQATAFSRADVQGVLRDIAAAKGNPQLDWQHSIVDLMKLLDIDSSLDNRKQLATELGYSGAADGSAAMNLWLHEKVMTELAANGGSAPAALRA